jgi:Gpi18-like mannosyltransferase
MTIDQLRPQTSERAPTGTSPLALAMFLGVAAALFGFMWLFADARMPRYYHDMTPANYGGPQCLKGWVKYDAGWYRDIAESGYYYRGDEEQSSVAFFPAYPLTMRGLQNAFGGNMVTWGIPVTFAAGLVSVVLFHRWAARRFGRRAAVLGTALVCLWPYAFYIYGTVYADAMFLAFVLLAFAFVDAGHNALAGLAGAVATATRPVGVAVLLGLTAVVWEQNRRAGRRPFRQRRDWSVLLAAGGLGAYATYLWVRFGTPFAFAVAEGAPGWDQKSTPATWFKFAYFDRIASFRDQGLLYPINLTAQMLLALSLLLIVIKARDRIGLGRTVYAVTVLAIPLIGSKDFQGLGRYCIAAFPAFGALGYYIAQHISVRMRVLLLVSSTVFLGVLSSAYARGSYVS